MSRARFMQLHYAGYVGAATLLSDKFERLDNPTSLGKADSGQTWVAQNGTWGTIGGAAYAVSDGNTNRAMILGLGTGDYTVEALASGHIANATNTSVPNIVFRYVDNSNWCYAALENNRVYLRKVDTASQSDFVSIPLALVDNKVYTYTIACYGDTVLLYIDGVLRINYKMTAGEYAKFGQGGGVGIRLTKAGTPTYNARFYSLDVS